MTNRKKKGDAETPTLSVPPPSPIPRELQTDRALLLNLHSAR